MDPSAVGSGGRSSALSAGPLDAQTVVHLAAAAALPVTSPPSPTTPTTPATPTLYPLRPQPASALVTTPTVATMQVERRALGSESDADEAGKDDSCGVIVADAPSSACSMHVLIRYTPVGPSLSALPNELLLHILGFLDVNDLLSISRTSRHLRCLCLAPFLHNLRRRRIRAVLAPLISPSHRPSLAELIARSIFQTHTTVVSRKLCRSLVSIRLDRRLAARPPARVLVERCVLPPECAPGIGHVAPALVARTRAIERERVKDGLRRWIRAVWKREVGRRSEDIRRSEERVGVGKVWRLRKFWEHVGRGEGPTT